MTERRLVKGCCPHDCQDTCSWVAHVEDDRVVRVEGAREQPFPHGVLCAKINDYEKRTYAPDRLLYPLRRTGPKGDGMFERISWDAALDIIGDRFTAIIAEYGGEALLPLNYLGSMGVVQRRALMRLFHALGASRQIGSICGAAGNTLAAEGHPLGFDPEQIAESRLVVVWGANLLTTSHHHWHFIEEARRRNGAIVVCVDPRRTRTAERCDRHLAVRPGTDRFLAASLAHVMFAEDLVDREFASVAADLDGLRSEVAPWTPTHASEVCDIPADDIVRLAREFAAAKPATIRGGIAPQQTAGGEAFVRSLSALAILGGHWRHPGGGLFIEASPVLHEARAARPDLLPRQTRRLDLARLGDNLTSTTLATPIKGLMVFGTNPAVVQQDVARTRAGLARDDLFTVVVEHFLTDTARYADILLPATMQIEHPDLLIAYGHLYVAWNEPAAAPPGECLPTTEIFRRLARKMGLDAPELLGSGHPALEGITLETLKARGWMRLNYPDPFVPFATAFPTPSGKLEFVSDRMAEAGLDRVAGYTPAQETS